MCSDITKAGQVNKDKVSLLQTEAFDHCILFRSLVAPQLISREN